MYTYVPRLLFVENIALLLLHFAYNYIIPNNSQKFERVY